MSLYKLHSAPFFSAPLPVLWKSSPLTVMQARMCAKWLRLSVRRTALCAAVWLQQLSAAQPRLKWGFLRVPDGMRTANCELGSGSWAPTWVQLERARYLHIITAHVYRVHLDLCRCVYLNGAWRMWGWARMGWVGWVGSGTFHAIKPRHSINQFDKYTNRSDWNHPRMPNQISFVGDRGLRICVLQCTGK